MISITNRTRRLAGAALLALGLSAGSLAANAVPAQAASYVEGCFKNATPGMNVQGLGVSAQAYWQGSWYPIWTGTLGAPVSYGSPLSCVYLNIGAANQSYPIRFVVSHRAYGATWSGVTPYTAPAGSGRWNIGNGTVTCVGCV